MDKDIVSNPCARIKSDAYRTAHEALCAKLQHAYTVAESTAMLMVLDHHELRPGQLHRLLCCLVDTLESASDECESLTPRDFEPDPAS